MAGMFTERQVSERVERALTHAFWGLGNGRGPIVHALYKLVKTGEMTRSEAEWVAQECRILVPLDLEKLKEKIDAIDTPKEGV